MDPEPLLDDGNDEESQELQEVIIDKQPQVMFALSVVVIALYGSRTTWAWMKCFNISSSQPGALNVTEAALRLTTL